MNRAYTHCCDCGAAKGPGAHAFSARCKPCGDHFSGWMFAANRAINRAKARGELKPASRYSCVDCGSQARDWEHRDYTKPLDVQPVCRRCNQHRGPALYPKRPELAQAAGG